MNCVSWVLSLLLAVAGSMPTRAQTLTEQQFLDDALASHPGVAVAETAVAAAAGARRQAGVFDNPELTWERESPSTASQQDTWRLSWRLPFDGRRYRMAAADAAVVATRFELDATRLDIHLELRSLFASWYIAAERAAVLQASLDRTRRLADWLRARADAGEAAGVEARRLELEVEVLDRKAATAWAEARAQQAAAAAWSDLVAGDVVPARPLLPAPPASADIEDRPDLKALAQRVTEAEARYRQRRQVFEPPEISAGWLEIRDSQQSFNGPVFGFTWPLPVSDRNQGARQAAAAEVERARAELELVKRQAEQQADAALACYADLFEAAVNGQAGDKGADVADAMLAAFEAGEASLTDVVDTLRAIVDVEMARVASLARALAAERELEAAVGRSISRGGSS
jgi:cobalt-zinc-cadmium efflux system outer membrane protein